VRLKIEDLYEKSTTKAKKMMIKIEPRCLLGPGPSNVHPRVLQALSYPLVGHLDPQFLDLMTKVQEMLRYTFRTENPLTIPVSGTGSAAMEAAVCNFIEPRDEVLICVNGYFGERLCDMAGRYGANVCRLDKGWGEVFTKEEIRTKLQDRPAKVVMMVHAETSTGALQPMEGIADIVHEQGGLLLVDGVTSLGGVRLEVDAWGIDIAYSGTQKCLSVPPGLGPITVSPRAMETLYRRTTPTANWYLDLSMVAKYWGSERTYHHTAPISMNYALYEGLQIVMEEGIEARWARHRANAELLWEGLVELGLKLVVPEETRLPSLTTVYIPDGLDDAAVRNRLLSRYNIEIAGGLGAYKGKIWRIGLMGYSSQPYNVAMLLSALKEIMN
jgi:alanine-glyoxylate transaminase / serine-glyoxylate transaminase / serine-pyruvate transaminase